MQLGGDKISPSGNPTDYLVNVGLPKWFAIGKRPVSIEQFTENNFIISPNPASDYIEIKFDNGSVSNAMNKIEIYNIFGVCVMTVYTKENVPIQRFDLSSLPNGTYFVKSQDNVQKLLLFK